VAVHDVVFLDDQPVNLAGATDLGMTAISVDVTDPHHAFQHAWELLGLAQPDVP
jgi:FMN phosphatase YigB (HAD superfamily)